MTSTRLRAASLWLTVCALVPAACLAPPPTPILPAAQVTLAAGAPTEDLRPAPELVPDLRCAGDGDCVFAYRADRCCDCGRIVNRTQAAADPRLSEAYGVLRRRNPPACANVMCAPCQEPPFGLVCDAGACRAARAWQEILPNCPQQTDHLVAWCFTSAALAAQRAGETEQAIAICNGEGLAALNGADQCLLQVARVLIAEDARHAAGFCRANLHDALSTCLGESARELAASDLEAGLALCAEISPQFAGDSGRDICFHNIAMLVAATDVARAQRICEQMSADVERCKETAGRQ